jgi:hypothetical protein
MWLIFMSNYGEIKAIIQFSIIAYLCIISKRNFTHEYKNRFLAIGLSHSAFNYFSLNKLIPCMYTTMNHFKTGI